MVSQPSDAGVSKSKDASENLKSTYSVKLKHNFNIKLIATVYAFTLLRDVLNIRKFTIVWKINSNKKYSEQTLLIGMKAID